MIYLLVCALPRAGSYDIFSCMYKAVWLRIGTVVEVISGIDPLVHGACWLPMTYEGGILVTYHQRKGCTCKCHTRCMLYRGNVSMYMSVSRFSADIHVHARVVSLP